jgi:hypothetical protein
MSHDLESIIPIEVSDKISAWVAEDLPSFFSSLEEAEHYIHELESQLEIIEPLVEEAEQRSDYGFAAESLPSRLKVRRKYKQQIAIVTGAIRQIYPRWGKEPSAVTIQDQLYSSKRQIKELNTLIHELKGNIARLNGEIKREVEARHKENLKRLTERKFYLRCIHALLSDDEEAKSLALERLKFIEDQPKDYGFEDL